MQKNISILWALSITLIGCTAILNGSDKGEMLFKSKCSHCHLETRPSFDKMDTMVAPPMMGVLFHVLEAKPTKPEAVAFIQDYILNPERSKSLCQAHSIKRFGLMPSQKGNLTAHESLIVSEYVYERFAN